LKISKDLWYCVSASNKNSTTGTVLPYFEKAAQARQGECIPIVLPDNSNSQLAPYYRIENDDLVYKNQSR
jgi:hypothetical protein